MVATVDNTTIQLGIPQLRVAKSSTHIGTATAVLSSSNSIGAISFADVESGLDKVFANVGGYASGVAVAEGTIISVDFMEVTPKNIAFSRGGDITDVAYANNHSAVVPIGVLSDTIKLRLELFYSFPDPRYTMTIIIPRAEVVSKPRLVYTERSGIKIPITIKALRADSGVPEGHTVWDTKPYGCFIFA